MNVERSPMKRSKFRLSQESAFLSNYSKIHFIYDRNWEHRNVNFLYWLLMKNWHHAIWAWNVKKCFKKRRKSWSQEKIGDSYTVKFNIINREFEESELEILSYTPRVFNTDSKSFSSQNMSSWINSLCAFFEKILF